MARPPRISGQALLLAGHWHVHLLAPGRRVRQAPRHCRLNCVRACSYAAVALSVSLSTHACADKPQPAVEIVAIGLETLLQPVDHASGSSPAGLRCSCRRPDPSVPGSSAGGLAPRSLHFGLQHGPPGCIGGRVGQEGLEGRLGLRRLALLLQRQAIEETRLGHLGIERQRLAQRLVRPRPRPCHWPRSPASRHSRQSHRRRAWRAA